MMVMTTKIDTGYFRNRYFKREWRGGEKAWLRWNGFPQVPKYMDGNGVTVLYASPRSVARIYRENDRVPFYVVRTDRFDRELTVRADQLEVPHG